MNDQDRVNSEQEPAEIRAEIDMTRAEMSETLNAIQERLNPQRIKQQAADSVRAATVGRVETMADDAKWKVKGVGEDVFETIKRNPAPALLTAVGLGWLFMESRNRQGRREMRYEPRDRYYYAGETIDRGGYEYGYDAYGRRGETLDRFEDRRSPTREVRERAGEVVGTATSRAQDAASTAGGKVQDAASTAASKVQSAATGVADTATSAAESVRYGAHQVAQEAQYRAERVGSRFGEVMEDNPLLIGAAAVALGAVIGLAFPASEKENQIFGEKRDEFMERAQEVVGEKVQQAQQVAQEVVETTKETAKETAKNAAERQNLGTNS
jgi:gas vesicle protein